MTNRYSTAAVLFLMALLVQACHQSPPTAPELPDGGDTSAAVTFGSSAKGGNGNGGGGGGGGESAAVTMALGMIGASQQVGIEKDSERELRLSGPYTNSVNMTATRANCDSEHADILDKLEDPAQERFRMVMVVDRSGGGNDRLTLNFDDYDGPLGSVVLNITNGVNVAETSTDVFQYSGGDVRIQHRVGKPKDYVTVVCQNLDTIEVALDRG